ncbi:ATP-binding protein [Cognataquiflexum rubidum]|uniref:ATP-binding protein n=1 Tax=Cognataquiflexum rubidum TaxID=2922273 RepID=UPI001F13D2FC|nr:ATP-binding protein [Cognataquiflexum rubidum]MCH6235771.1 ATP-binding protein [Cognataquiflexum rubidum]
MKSFISILIILLLTGHSQAQQFPYWEIWNKTQVDSLRSLWNYTSNDTIRLGTARSLCAYYTEIKLDSALYFAKEELNLARKLKQPLWEADALDMMAYVLSNLKDYPGSLQAFLSAMKIAKDRKSENDIWQISRFTTKNDPAMARLTVLAFCHLDLGRLYGYTGNIEQHNYHLFESLKLAQQVNDPSILSNIYSNLGTSFALQNKLDSALFFLDKSMGYYEISGFNTYKGGTMSTIGMVHAKKGNYIQAKQYLIQAIQVSRNADNITDLSRSYLRLSDFFNEVEVKDSSLWYAYKALESAQLARSPDVVLPAYAALAYSHKLLNNIDSAYYYQGLSVALKDSINSLERINQFQNIGFSEKVQEQELEKERLAYQGRIRTNSLAGGLLTLTIIAFLLYRNNRQKLKANTVLRKTLDDLAATQAQLIQSEKMASLGELTAGIAHEIQNPLNFVNNFSEVSTELLDEMNEELDKGDIEEAKFISKDIKENLIKINHHGKRADAIVKGMLEHSKRGSGQREPTDLNALADEFLRLSYQSFLAKDPNFKVELQTNLDSDLPKISVIPQDIGKVLLNLYSNAFYAVNERSKQDPDFKPLVQLTTRNLGGKIEVGVKDNGPGIPDSIKDKIFQPFFTTKPTGQGTGLGLSLSYDIVKAHGGELRVETEIKEGSKFIIILPI